MSNDELDRKGLTFIRNYYLATKRAPSLRSIGDVVGYQSPRSVQMMLKRLAIRGLLRYEAGEISMSEEASAASPHTVDVPVVGSVACGLPSLAEQDPEGWVRVSTRMAPAGHTFYLLRARGTSMNAARIPINPGELVLVRQQAHANPNDLVVALIDNEATIKEFSRQGQHVVLRPRSTDPEHKPIVVTDDLVIQGVVVDVIPDVLS
ncbi:MAG: repressor LexA [Flavobacteriales bacterium]|nr:repressor LexA [Flavobacteriales bacterium]MBP6696540.1 repressor LexA [Flavobacteriales bacterium]